MRGASVRNETLGLEPCAAAGASLPGRTSASTPSASATPAAVPSTSQVKSRQDGSPWPARSQSSLPAPRVSEKAPPARARSPRALEPRAGGRVAARGEPQRHSEMQGFVRSKPGIWVAWQRPGVRPAKARERAAPSTRAASCVATSTAADPKHTEAEQRRKCRSAARRRARGADRAAPGDAARSWSWAGWGCTRLERFRASVARGATARRAAARRHANARWAAGWPSSTDRFRGSPRCTRCPTDRRLALPVRREARWCRRNSAALATGAASTASASRASNATGLGCPTGRSVAPGLGRIDRRAAHEVCPIGDVRINRERALVVAARGHAEHATVGIERGTSGITRANRALAHPFVVFGVVAARAFRADAVHRRSVEPHACAGRSGRRSGPADRSRRLRRLASRRVRGRAPVQSVWPPLRGCRCRSGSRARCRSRTRRCCLALRELP